MKRIKKALFLAVILLVLFSLVASPAYAELEVGTHPELLARAEVISAALDTAMKEQADSVDQTVALYREEGTVLKDEDGNDVDMDALLSALEEAADSLRVLAPDAYQLAILEHLYENRYIGSYSSFEELAPSIAEYILYYFNLPVLAQSTAYATEGMIYAYQRLVGDIYASYYNEEEYVRFEEGEEAQYSGIGVTVSLLDDGYAEILAVTPDSPAEGAGIQPGDILVAVGDEDFAEIGYSAALNRIRGESGTEVTITVRRNGVDLTFTMKRAILTEYSVEYKMLASGDGKIGFIRITEFDEGTFAQFKTAYETLSSMGAEKYVFDVRHNPGGRVDSVLAVLEYILPDDSGLPMLHMQYKNETKTFYTLAEYLETKNLPDGMYEGSENHAIDAPIAVLCNEYTVSAGEIFVSCLKDFEVAEVYGVTTYGKGTGQTGFFMSDLYAYGNIGYSYFKYALINISAFYFYTPLSEKHEGIGIEPDHVVELSEEAAQINFYKLTEEDDDQLAAAVAYLESIIIPPDDASPDDNAKPQSPVLWVLFGILAAACVALIVFLIVLLKRAKKDAYPTYALSRDEDDPQN